MLENFWNLPSKIICNKIKRFWLIIKHISKLNTKKDLSQDQRCSRCWLLKRNEEKIPKIKTAKHLRPGLILLFSSWVVHLNSQQAEILLLQ